MPQKWTYTSTAQLQNDAGRWKTAWQASIVAAAAERLEPAQPAPGGRRSRRGAGRGRRRDRQDAAGGADRDRQDRGRRRRRPQTSATKLAKLVDIDATTYAKKVAAAGDDAFVEAITYRATDDDRPSNADVFAIKGALPIQGEQMLAPTRDFARPILGIVGQATKEIVDDSDGAVVAGDEVGPVGAAEAVRQHAARYAGRAGAAAAADLRVLGVTVALGLAVGSALAESVRRSRAAAPAPAAPVTVFEAKPVAGKDLRLTLNALPAGARREDPGRHQAGERHRRDPAVHRSRARRGERIGEQGPEPGHHRSGRTRLDLQGRLGARPAAGRREAVVRGEVPGDRSPSTDAGSRTTATTRAVSSAPSP